MLSKAINKETIMALRLTCLLSLCLIGAQGNQIDAAEALTEEEQKLLPKLTPKFAASVLEIATKAEQWQKKITEWKQDLEKRKAQGEELLEQAEGVSLPKLIEEIVSALKPLVKENEELNEILQFSKKVEPIIQKAEQQWKNATYDPQKYFDLDEEAFREEQKELAMAYAASQLLKILESEIFTQILTLKNPAQFAKDFVESKLQEEFLNREYSVGEVKFKLVKENQYVKSVFHEEANVAIVLTYGETGIEVKATGLYFEYQTNGLPKPVFGKVKVEAPSLKSLVSAGISKGLDALLPMGNLGPIKIKGAPKFNGFDDPDPKRQGSLELTIGLDFNGILDVIPNGKLSGDVTLLLYTNRPPEIRDATPEATIPAKIPLGPYLMIEKFNLKYQVKEKKSTVTTYIVPTATSSSVVSLDLSVELAFPVREVKFTGFLRLGGEQGQALAKVDCTITGRKMEGNLWFPPPNEDPLNIAAVLKGDFSFHLDKKGFTADGMVSLFGCAESSFHLVMQFNGNGSITADRSINLGGALKANALFNCSYTPGFKNVHLRLVLMVEVDLKIFKADASVEVNATKEGRDVAIQVQAKACGVDSVTFEVDALNQITLEKITEELLKNLGSILDNISEAAAQMEKEARETLAQWEKHWRTGLSKQFAKWKLDSVSTGNKEVDRVLGDISKTSKKVGKFAGELRGKTGDELTKLREQPLKQIANAPKSFVKDLENGWDALSNIFNPQKRREEKRKRDRERAKAQQRENRANLFIGEMTALVNAINDLPAITREKKSPDRSTAHYKSGSRTRFQFRFMDAVSNSSGDGHGQILLTIRAAGYDRQVNSRTGRSITRTGSDVKAILIQFTDFATGNGKKGDKPKAKIHLPAFNHGSSLPARLIAYDELYKLIERFHPEVEIEGLKRLYDKQLRLVNGTREKIHVRVLARVRELKDGQFQWQWLPSAPPGSKAIQVTVEPGKSLMVPKQTTITGEASEVQTASPLYASRVRLWAESELGQRWLKYQSKDLWLVEPNSNFNDERMYHAEQRKTYTYTFRPSTSYRTFSERVIELRNATSEPLLCRISYFAREDGRAQWRSLPDFTIPAGTTYKPKHKNGFRIRASQIRFMAASETVAYTTHRTRPLKLISEKDGNRLYRAKKIGTYTHTFKSLSSTGKRR